MMLVLPAKTTVASHESVNEEEKVGEGQALQQVLATMAKLQECRAKSTLWGSLTYSMLQLPNQPKSCSSY